MLDLEGKMKLNKGETGWLKGKKGNGGVKATSKKIYIKGEGKIKKAVN